MVLTGCAVAAAAALGGSPSKDRILGHPLACRLSVRYMRFICVRVTGIFTL